MHVFVTDLIQNVNTPQHFFVYEEAFTSKGMPSSSPFCSRIIIWGEVVIRRSASPNSHCAKSALNPQFSMASEIYVTSSPILRQNISKIASQCGLLPVSFRVQRHMSEVCSLDTKSPRKSNQDATEYRWFTYGKGRSGGKTFTLPEQRTIAASKEDVC